MAKVGKAAERPAGGVPHIAPLIPDPRGAAVDPETLRFRRRAVLGLLLILFVVVPLISLVGQVTGKPIMEDHDLNRLGRYLCFAIAALGLDLIWGYAGVLSLCHA